MEVLKLCSRQRKSVFTCVKNNQSCKIFISDSHSEMKQGIQKKLLYSEIGNRGAAQWRSGGNAV